MKTNVIVNKILEGVPVREALTTAEVDDWGSEFLKLSSKERLEVKNRDGKVIGWLKNVTALPDEDGDTAVQFDFVYSAVKAAYSKEMPNYTEDFAVDWLNSKGFKWVTDHSKWERTSYGPGISGEIVTLYGIRPIS